MKHVERINGDERFYPEPMKDYGTILCTIRYVHEFLGHFIITDIVITKMKSVKHNIIDIKFQW